MRLPLPHSAFAEVHYEGYIREQKSGSNYHGKLPFADSLLALMNGINVKGTWGRVWHSLISFPCTSQASTLVPKGSHTPSFHAVLQFPPHLGARSISICISMISHSHSAWYPIHILPLPNPNTSSEWQWIWVPSITWETLSDLSLLKWDISVLFFLQTSTEKGSFTQAKTFKQFHTFVW